MNAVAVSRDVEIILATILTVATRFGRRSSESEVCQASGIDIRRTVGRQLTVGPSQGSVRFRRIPHSGVGPWGYREKGAE